MCGCGGGGGEGGAVEACSAGQSLDIWEKNQENRFKDILPHISHRIRADIFEESVSKPFVFLTYV